MTKLTQEFSYLGRKYQAEIVFDGDEYSIETMWFYVDMGLNVSSRWLRVDVTEEELSLYVSEDSDGLFGKIDEELKTERLNDV